MAKFCRFCGKELNIDGICKCREEYIDIAKAVNQNNTNEKKQDNIKNQTVVIIPQSIFGTKIKEFFATFVSYLKNPSATTKKAVKENDILIAIMFVIINAISVGIFLNNIASKFLNNLGYSAKYIAKKFANILVMFDAMPTNIDYWSPNVIIPTMNILAFGALCVAIIYIIASVVFYLVNRILGLNTSFQKIMIGLGLGTIIPTLILIIMSIGILISFDILIFLVVIFMITITITTVIALENTLEGYKEGGFYLSMMLSIFVLFVFSFYTFSNIMPVAYGNIQIEGTKLLVWFNEIAAEIKAYI